VLKKIAFSLLSITLLLTACSTTQKVTEQPPETPEYNVGEYSIGVSDELAISVWKHPDISVELPVRPDGKISIPLIGDILAAGKSPTKLSEDITLALQTVIRTPQVTVLVSTPSSTDFLQRVRVTGAVENQTSTPYRKGMTVLDLVLLAGGLNDFAAENNAKLYRKINGQTKVYPVYLGDILNKGKLDTNYNLAPSDIVTVPERSF
jgi:polysaccharide export outer membrane protein